MATEVVINDRRVTDVIDAMLDGSSLRDALKKFDLTPQKFNLILQSDRQAALLYQRAVEMKADLIADETIAIADSDDDPAKARNRITARQWLAGKLNKRYGERVDLNVSQTIDVGSTLAEARARLSTRYQQPLEHVQVVDSPSERVQGALDRISHELAGNPQPDIFD